MTTQRPVRSLRKQFLDFDLHSLDILRHHNPNDGTPNDYLLYYGPERISFILPQTASNAGQVIQIPGQPPATNQVNMTQHAIVMVGWWWKPINFTNPGFQQHFVAQMAFQMKHLADPKLNITLQGNVDDLPKDYDKTLIESVNKIADNLMPTMSVPQEKSSEDSELGSEDDPPPGVIIV
jgi:hypothetical protein